MTVLIMTHSQDNDCVDRVSRAVAALGHKTVRCDTDLFPTRERLAAGFSAAGERLLLRSAAGGETLDLGEVTALWNRRYFLGRAIPESLDPQLRQPSVEESRHSFFGTVACLEAFCLDPLKDAHYARHKPLQLQIARRLGIEIPRTLITNDPQAVRELAAECPAGIVTKMMTSFAVFDPDGRESVVFTNPLGEADLADLDGLDLCPMTFQENVPKAAELRVTVVGRRVFAAEVDSQASERATHDWRRDGAGLLEDWQACELPAELERQLLGLCDRLGLNYGAIDLILTPDGRYVFLEINPVGEFFWLEHQPGFAISAAIAEVLVDPRRRRLP